MCVNLWVHTKNKQFNKAFLMAGRRDAATWTCRQWCGKVTCPKHIGNWALKYHLPCFLHLRSSGLWTYTHVRWCFVLNGNSNFFHDEPNNGVGAAKMWVWGLNYSTVLLLAPFCSCIESNYRRCAALFKYRNKSNVAPSSVQLSTVAPCMWTLSDELDFCKISSDHHQSHNRKTVCIN